MFWGWFGDLFQLPPVVTEEDKPLFDKFNYRTPYFFSSEVFKSISKNVKYVEFTHIFRQTDLDFINIHLA